MVRETNELSIAQLVADIQEYVDGKGKDFRLLFMVDEVGQYIGDDGDLMINLQSLVKRLASRYHGKVWVMVTSQEAIDSVVHITGNDFSKIQGRFNTRLSLSSSSVDEVIKSVFWRKQMRQISFFAWSMTKEHAVLKNLYTFNNPVLDIKGFTDGAGVFCNFPLCAVSVHRDPEGACRDSQSTAIPASICPAVSVPCSPASKKLSTGCEG